METRELRRMASSKKWWGLGSGRSQNFPARFMSVIVSALWMLTTLPLGATDRPPNVVLIISDDQGWADHGFMGHPVIRTPHLDRLASESMVFTRVYVPTSLCRPSLASMVTGLYPHQHKITGNDPKGKVRDPENRARMVNIFNRSKTVPFFLGEKGYLSHQSGKWWEGGYKSGGFTHGMTHGDPTRGGRHGDEGLKIGRETMQPIYDFVEKAGDTPFFLWYAPFMPHRPHNPPERLLNKYLAPNRPIAISRYYAMCEWFDETVGELLSYLDKKGLKENTLVLYVCDNGWIQAENPKPGIRTRAKLSPYDAGLRTPVIMRWPGKVKPGRDEKTLASSIDLAPTILKACGIEPPPDMPGIDLRDRAGLSGRKAIFGGLFTHTAVDIHSPGANLKYRWGIRGEWKLILPYTPNADLNLTSAPRAAWVKEHPELYQVVADPHEKEDLAAKHPGIVQALKQEINQWWAVPK